jgi:hypothetical protein
MMPYKSGLDYSMVKVNTQTFRYNSFSSWKEDLTVIEGSNSRTILYLKPFNTIELTLRVKRFFSLMNISKHLI